MAGVVSGPLGDFGMVMLTVFVNDETRIEVKAPTPLRPSWALAVGHLNMLSVQMRDRATLVRLRDVIDAALAEPEPTP